MYKILIALLLVSTSARADLNYDKLASRIRETLAEMIAADTTSPPGNEARVVKIVEKRLKSAEIPYEITEFEPGRQNIVARFKGSDPSEKPILLISHTDVVGVANQNWSVPTHKLTEKDGYLYGRGIMDDLGMGAVDLETLIAMKDASVKFRRDIILALTGDEESGGAGVRYILKHKPETLDAAFALNEGGGLSMGADGKVSFISLQVAEKTYQDFEISATGTTGHSSVPLKDNAIYKLGAALAKLGRYERPARLLPVTRAYFLSRSKIEKEPLASAMKKVALAKGKLPADAVKILDANPIQAANLRTTCVATMLSGGTRVNALPAEAKANVNCRILPDEKIADVLADLERVTADTGVKIQAIGNMDSAPASSLDDGIVKSIQHVAEKFWPSVLLVPTMSRGATDSRFLRAHGIPSYGMNPIPIADDDERRAHGVDERLASGSLKIAAEYLHELLLDVAGAK